MTTMKHIGKLGWYKRRLYVWLSIVFLKLGWKLEEWHDKLGKKANEGHALCKKCNQSCHLSNMNLTTLTCIECIDCED